MQTYGDYDARVRESFARQAMMRSLGVEIVSVGAGDVVFEMPFGADFTQQHGFMHAGAITTVLDSAAGFGEIFKMPEKTVFLPIELKT